MAAGNGYGIMWADHVGGSCPHHHVRVMWWAGDHVGYIVYHRSMECRMYYVVVVVVVVEYGTWDGTSLLLIAVVFCRSLVVRITSNLRRNRPPAAARHMYSYCYFHSTY